MVWVFAGDEWHQRGRPTPRLNAQSFKAALSSYLPGNSSNTNAQQRGSWATAPGGGSGPAWGIAAGRVGARPGRLSNVTQSISSGLGYGTRDELEESLLPWAIAEDEPGSSYELGNGVQGTAADAQQGLAQHPQSVAERFAALQLPARGSGSGTGGSTGLPSNASSAQFSTELSDFGAAPLMARQARAASVASSMQGGSPMHARSAAASSPFLQQQQQQLWASRDNSSYSRLLGTAPGPSSRALPQTRSWSPPAAAATPQNLNPLLHPAQPHLVSFGSHSYLDPKTYKQLVWADLADDAEEEARLERDIARQLLARRASDSFAGAGAGGQS
eukprot:GHRQ01016349.1.p1 GENE.GHRQ01016349.1~~GHRQ01016349.1.p1  ORF type:complete len:331 (-),score=74.32 GHRQ01016349.1:60-1052(-)